jgi:hypothetical protein
MSRYLLITIFLTFSFFLLAIPVHAAPLITNITDNRNEYPSSQIPKYDKFEITFNISEVEASNLQLPYLSSTNTNQYLGKFIDVGITVKAEFTSDNWQTIYEQPAFYYQNYSLNPTDSSYMYPLLDNSWKVRFSPHVVGNWQYRLSAQDRGGTITSPNQVFTVTDSTNKGFIKVSESDPRYFEFDDGTYFTGTSINTALNQLHNDSVIQELDNHNIQLIRAWIAPFNIYGSSWDAWSLLPGKYDGYLPRTAILPLEDTPGQPMKLMYYLSQTSTWYEQCAFLGHTQHIPNVKPYADYHITAKYKTVNVTGPRDTSISSNYGFVIKMGGWQHDPNSGVYCENPSKPTDPNWTKTTPLTNYGISTNWDTVTGEWNSGNKTKLDYFYIALENASSGVAYIESIEMREIIDRTTDTYGANIIDKPSANSLEYYAQKPSFKMDQIVEKLASTNIYIRPVVMEKNDYVSGKTDAYGYPQFQDTINNFYGAPNGCGASCRNYTAQRWLQEAWYRYIQARWGYSTHIHSWELVNEGDPWHDGHYAQTDEMGKFLKCRVFGVNLGYNDSEKCLYDHPNSHMTNTSFWHSFPVTQFWNNSKYPNQDYADIHAYISTSNGLDYSSPCGKYEMLVDAAAYHQCHSQQYSGWNIGKPIVRGEAGLDSPAQQNGNGFDIQLDTKDIWLHNYLWAGLSSGGLLEQYWWREHLFQAPATGGSAVFDRNQHYTNFYHFTHQLPLNSGNYNDAAATSTNPNIRVWGQKDTVNNRAHLWIQNSHHTWANAHVMDNATIISFGKTDTNVNIEAIFHNPVTTTSAIGIPSLSRQTGTDINLISDTCNTLEPGQSCTINIMYTPTAKSARAIMDIPYSYTDSNGNIQNRIYTKTIVARQPNIDESATITIPGFPPNTPNIPIEYWDTYTGTVATTDTVSTDASGNITLTINNLSTDMAVKIGDYSDIDPTPLPTITSTPGDTDADGDVDLVDYQNLLGEFDTTNCSGSCMADFDGDGSVTIFDHSLLVTHYGN